MSFGHARMVLLLTALTGLLIGASCDGGGCPTVCQPGQRQCSTGGVLTCVLAPGTQCFSWGVQPCPTGQSCQMLNGVAQCAAGTGPGPGPNPNCNQPKFKKQCVGQAIYWFDNCGKQGELWTTCPAGLSCVNGLCVQASGCENPCTPGATQCSADGTGLQTCPNDGSNCPKWGPATPCPQGQSCKDARCQAAGGCTKECQVDALRCQGNSVQVCQETSPNCSAWSQPQSCPPGQTCSNGFCGGGGGPCKDECTANQQRCQGTQKQICKSNGQCLVWSANPCGVNAQCVAAGGRVGCSCLPGYNPSPNGRDCVKGNSNPNPGPGPAPDPNPNPNPNPNPDPPKQDCGMNALEKGVLQLVNQERAKVGARALGCHEKLVIASRDWSKQQCAMRRLSHANLNARVAKTGLSVSGSGENVAWGSATAAGVMRMWMNSSGHRRNILSSTYTHIGIGLDPCGSKNYWTQIFVRMR